MIYLILKILLYFGSKTIVDNDIANSVELCVWKGVESYIRRNGRNTYLHSIYFILPEAFKNGYRNVNKEAVLSGLRGF
jgi:hypothetical protein